MPLALSCMLYVQSIVIMTYILAVVGFQYQDVKYFLLVFLTAFAVVLFFLHPIFIFISAIFVTERYELLKGEGDCRMQGGLT